MQHGDHPGTADEHTAPALAERRSALKTLGGLMGLGIATSFAMGGRVAAQQEASGLANRSFSQKELQGKPWIPSKLGNFNLRDPWENRLAAMKATNNLIGAKTYVPMISRALLGPPGTAGAPLYGHVGLWTWQLQEPDPAEFPDAPAGSFVQRAMFTGAILSPYTYERVDSVYNHVLDKDVEAEDSLFAESYVFYPKGGATSVDRPEFMDDDPELLKSLRPFVRFGDEVTMFVDGIFHNEGPHQPGYYNAMSNAPRGAPEANVPRDEEQVLTTKVGDQSLHLRLDAALGCLQRPGYAPDHHRLQLRRADARLGAALDRLREGRPAAAAVERERSQGACGGGHPRHRAQEPRREIPGQGLSSRCHWPCGSTGYGYSPTQRNARSGGGRAVVPGRS